MTQTYRIENIVHPLFKHTPLVIHNSCWNDLDYAEQTGAGISDNLPVNQVRHVDLITLFGYLVSLACSITYFSSKYSFHIPLSLK